MRRVLLVGSLLVCAAGLIVLLLQARIDPRALLRPEPPVPITPLSIVAAPSPTLQPAIHPSVVSTSERSQTEPTRLPSAPTTLPTPRPTQGPVEINGRLYTAYIPAASKEHQFFRYSCEFDAAWVILTTYGIDAPFEEMLAAIGTDDTVEPFIEETSDGFLIHGGDIGTSFSGDYTANFLARSTGMAFRDVFASYGLTAELVHDRAGVEHAIRGGALIWMKTTVDFKPWRPATWITPDGTTYTTVLGNDHAVVVIGFNEEVVVIRDVLGPTSTNQQRPYEYEVSWDIFLASWGAQAYDGLAVFPPVSA